MSKIHIYLLTKARKDRRLSFRIKSMQLAGRVAWSLAALLISVLIFFIIIFGWQYTSLTSDLPSIDRIPAEINAQSAIFTRPSRLLDRDGSNVLFELTTPGVQRQYIRIKGIGGHVSQDYLDALVAILEPRFWSSPGFTLNITNPDEHPTIAQRLVYSILLSQEKSESRRAVRERILAAQLVARYGREKVLEWYINSLNNGNYAYGVEAAAQTYFGKSSTDLTLPEAAILAGTAAAPALNPWDSPKGARALQIQVLKTMASQKVITAGVANVAVQVVVPFPSAAKTPDQKNQAFIDHAMLQLEKVIGKERLERGGIIVQTTLDQDLQNAMECMIRAQISAIGGNDGDNIALMRTCQSSRLLPLLPPGDSLPQDDLSASIIVMDVDNSKVAAYVSGLKYNGSSKGATTHPSGSILYPAVYLNAFTQGFAPASLVWDVPATTEEVISSKEKHVGPVNIRTALIQNDSAPISQLLDRMGPSSFNRFLDANEIHVKLEGEDPKIEAQLISEIQVTAFYNQIASGGYIRGLQTRSEGNPQPVFIEKVWDANNQLIYEFETPAEISIVSPQVTYLLTSVLNDSNTRQKSTGISSILETSRDTAVLVDTTGLFNQSWAAGYTPQRTIIAWIGTQPDSESVKVDPRWSSGLWRAAMLTSLKGYAETRFIEPAGIAHVQVCVPSGNLPSTDCPQVQEDLFLIGNEPLTIDTLYSKYAINAETNRLATVFTPENLVKEQTFLNTPTDYRQWAIKAGLPVPPTDYDMIRNAQVDPAVHFSTPEIFQIVKGKVEINGSASAKDFAVYRLHYGIGLNPTEWQQIGTDGEKPIVESVLGTWDTTGLNGLAVLRLQVVDTSQVVRNTFTQVVVDNIKPEVGIAYPAANLTINQNDMPSIFIRAITKDNVGIKEIRIIIDGSIVAALISEPFAINWDSVPGEHTLVVEAEDQAGNISTSLKIQLLVK